MNKNAYVEGFKKSHLTLTEYCRMMKLKIEDMKNWLKEYKEPELFGKINLADLMEKDTKESSPKVETSISSPLKFETSNIKIELKEGYDKKLLKDFIEMVTRC